MTTIFNRRVLLTTLDPVPPGLRTTLGCIAMNQRELDAFNAGDPATFEHIVRTCEAADARDARFIGVHRRRKVPKAKLDPSARLYMANAIYKGRK